LDAQLAIAIWVSKKAHLCGGFLLNGSLSFVGKDFLSSATGR
jgi:hypothetical protein